MERIVRDALTRKQTRIGGVSLAGVLRLVCDPPHEIGNDAACFYVYVLSLARPDLADHLESNGTVADALRKAGWNPFG